MASSWFGVSQTNIYLTSVTHYFITAFKEMLFLVQEQKLKICAYFHEDPYFLGYDRGGNHWVCLMQYVKFECQD